MMKNQEINQALLNGNINMLGVLPHIEQLKEAPFIFEQYFGLPELPMEPGVISIRGPRQYGKSTWLEQQIALSIKQFGTGCALYLNGDEIIDHTALTEAIKLLIQLFAVTAKVKRLFIDEITAIQHWEKSIKRLIDGGELKDVLVITTGSRATDLRRGIERLPGRKGKLDRTQYIFTPIAYREFFNKCGNIFKSDAIWAYMLSGGSAVGINALATTGHLPNYVITMISDWVLGECSANQRSRSHLLAVLQSLYRMAGTSIGQAKLARESGLSNNTVAQGYIELLSDLMTIIPSFPYDKERKITLFRKPCKYHFTNLLMALCWHPAKPRTIAELKACDKDLGPIFEWVVAQEIWRKFCISSAENLPDHLNFWQSNQHEIDFILPEKNLLLEVKVGKANITDFMWFLKIFNTEKLTIINKNCFESQRLIGITLEDFLLS
jgi:uncharacterized protein